MAADPTDSYPAVAQHKTKPHQRYSDVYTDRYPAEVVNVEHIDTHLLLSCRNGMCLLVQALTDDILRLRYSPDGLFDAPFPYALRPDLPVRSVVTSFEEQSDYIYYRTPQLSLQIRRTDLQVRFYQRDRDQLLLRDARPYRHRSTILHGTTEVSVCHHAPRRAAYFGLGDKTGALNLRGQRYENWCTDAFGYSAESDALYRAVPFYYGVSGGKAYGIFLHNTFKSHFDFGLRQKSRVCISAAGGELDYCFMYGPELDTVAAHYHYLTGVPELPPMWALGYHQCRWSYHPEHRVRDVAGRFRALRIPCDAIYLDIDYMDGYRCFTWDREHFSDPAMLIDDLRRQGFQTVVMIDPGIRVDADYTVYTEGLAKGVFCRRSNGELMRGPVWPPDCVWPDFTNPMVRTWWGKLYRELYTAQGVAGFWNDMNEPAVFQVERMTFPDAVLHHCDGQMDNHQRAHNIYGMQMAQASFEGLKILQPNKRPFLLSRASFSGGQRYAALWTGDNLSTWEHLRLANIQCQRMSISGFSFVGTDIGGFAGRPSGELMVRWLQLGVFHPLFRVHSIGNKTDGSAAVGDEVDHMELIDRLDQEPWSFGEPFTSLARTAIEWRYQLLGYLYTAMYQMTTLGLPVIRSLVFADQRDVICREREVEFLWGEHLLVRPILRRRSKREEVYLPRGWWYDFRTGDQYTGRAFHRIGVQADCLPVFARAGSCVPIFPVRLHTGMPIRQPVVLRVFFGRGKHISHWYEDAGEGYGYTDQDYLLRMFTLQGSARKLTLQQSRSGEWTHTLDRLRIEFVGLPFIPGTFLVDGTAVDALDGGRHPVIEVPERFGEVVVGS